MDRLTMVAPVSSYTGYGLHLEQIVTHLGRMGIFASVRAVHVEDKMGIRIQRLIRERLVRCTQPEPWEIVLAPPQVPVSPAKKTLYYTMWESDTLPRESVAILNKAAVVCVPCHWNKETFERCGVKRPIHIVPLGIDPAIFAPRPMKVEGPCVFGAAGRLAHGRKRKGVLDVLDLFLEAFPNNEEVELHIKAHPDDAIPDYPDWAWLKVNKAHFTDQAVADWLGGLTAFVSMAAGEGWGLWQQQAMAVGRPCIAAIYGGLREYMDDSNCFPVDYVEGEAEDGYPGKWAVLDRTSVIWALRQVYKQRQLAREVGLAAQEAGRFTWERSVERLMEVLAGAAHGTPVTLPTWKVNQGSYPVAVACSVNGQLDKMGLEHGEIHFNNERLNFNAGLGLWNGGRILMVRSAVHNHTGETTDNHIDVYGWEKAPLHKARIAPPADTDWIEDPRVVGWRVDRLMSFTRVRRNMAFQCLATLDGDCQITDYWQVDYGKNRRKGPEKNWLWFPDRELWHVVYSTRPHVVLRISSGGKVEEVMETRSRLECWEHGQPRGGTPPIQVGDEFFSLFHSRLPRLGWRAQYFAGAYAFEAKPPYRITRITPAPLLYGRHDEEGVDGRYAVIFPMGAVYDERAGEWLVTAGVNDARTIWWKMKHEWLLSRMMSV